MLTPLGIVIVLLAAALQFYREVAPWVFLFGTRWSPLLKPQHFGILPLLCGTCLGAAGAAVVAIPIGLCTAIYLSEYAPKLLREIVKPLLEILAGIPSVVYGYLAIVFVSPIIRSLFESANVFNAASASM